MIAIPNPNSRVVTICFRHKIHLAILFCGDWLSIDAPPAVMGVETEPAEYITVGVLRLDSAAVISIGRA